MTPEHIKLLLVDDETDFRESLSKLLLKKGIPVEQAEDGNTCLALLAMHSMDVVVLDVKLPDMSGLEVLREIKARAYSVEIILLTGEASTQGGVEGIKAGAFDYLSKPVDIEHLVTKITQAYEKILAAKEQQRISAFRKKVEKQMMATERLAALGTLAAGVAHEINNPLAIINESAGWIRLLLQKSEPGNFPYQNDIEHALKKIEKSIDRAKHVTHQMLGLVKNHDLDFIPVKPAELVREAVQLISRLAKKKGVFVRFGDSAEDLEIPTDPYQLRQLLINLLSNAVQAEHSGGTVTVALRREPQSVLLSVQDTGAGIPKENRGKIFDPFFTTKKPGEGTGLGLFVSRRIAERIRGEIDFESHVGRGTTFFVRLPLEAQGLINQEFDV
jgi:signal transduction histidine kinase